MLMFIFKKHKDWYDVDYDHDDKIHTNKTYFYVMKKIMRE